LGEPDRAAEFDGMSVDEYADHRGLRLTNPIRERRAIMRERESCCRDQWKGLVSGPWVEYKKLSRPGSELEERRRVVAKIEHHQGELFLRVGFIVTHLTPPSRAVVRFYNKRGTPGQWIKEGRQAVKMTRLSCHRFRSNEVRFAVETRWPKSGDGW
jgi:hypothetical protein